jgi:tetratricopeptide (TPR) repeat protein
LVLMAAFAGAGTDHTCGICLENMVDSYALDCAHEFCRACINAYQKHGVNDVCPYCRAPLPPGYEYSINQCHQMGARIQRYESDRDIKRVQIAWRLYLHHSQKAVNADPKQAMAHFYLALCLISVSNDIGGAISQYHQAIRCNPDLTDAHYNLGNLLHARADYDGSEREYREAIRCDPNHRNARHNFGLLLYTVREDFGGAEREYREAIRCDPNDASARVSLGVLMKNVRKDYEGAEREYREAIRCDTNFTRAHFVLGNLLCAVRNYGGAEREYGDAIRCDPNLVAAHFNLGALLMNVRGNHAGAALQFREVLRCDPNHAMAPELLAQALRLAAEGEGAPGLKPPGAGKAKKNKSKKKR